MKAHWLLRLYPRAWRERYGDEFLALVESEHLRPRLLVDVIRAAAGEWTSTGLRSVGRGSMAAASEDLLGGLRGALALACVSHTLVWVLACIEGWVIEGALSAHPEWWTLDALWLSASIQLSSGVAAAVFGMGLVVAFARGTHKTRSQVLAWLPFTTVIVVAMVNAAVLDAVPARAAMVARLGDSSVGALMMVPAIFVADWVRALGRRRLDPDDELEHLSA